MFALGLVMIALLFLSLVFGGPWTAQIRWATFVALGLAPVAFLVGLLQSRLARSGVGDLLVELREDSAPADLRDAVARALGDPLGDDRVLAAASSGAGPIWRAGRWSCPSPATPRAMTPIERDGERARRCSCTTPRCATSRSCSRRFAPRPRSRSRTAACTPSCGLAWTSSRARACAIIEAGQKERQRLERNLHDGAQQRLIALSLELSLLEDDLAGQEARSGASRPRPARDRLVARGAP